jgi:hypothetical protein
VRLLVSRERIPKMTPCPLKPLGVCPRLLSFTAVFCLVCLPALGQVNENTPGYFPFTIPPLDASASFTDMSFLSPEPAGASGRVAIRDGHFVDGRGNRLRLLGSNLTFAGAFPDKDLAPRIAGHMRKLGMNVIRFHHMDNSPAPRGIWTPDFSALDPDQMDRLDWLIFQLKQHGVYANLNLHVSRTYPGIPREAPASFKYGKGLDNFYPPFIELQKEYARRLLTHRNPYTETTYAEEPAVVVVELNNENSLTDKRWPDLRAMPEPFLGELARQWQAWLKQRYGTTEKLREVWNEGSEPLGKELLTNADFATGVEAWTPEQGGGAKMTTTAVQDGTVPGGHALQVTTQKPGSQAWNLQFHQKGLTLAEGRPYTLSFRARAGQSRSLAFGVRLDKEPWTMCGLNASADLTTEWRQFTEVFKCVDPEPAHVRLSFNFNNQLGDFWLADISLRPGGLIGLSEDQSLEAGNLPIAPTNASDAQKADFYQFLSDTECRYVTEMIRYLKSDLGVKAPICDSQASYGGLQGMVREGTLSDYVDMHAYWQHPRFPGQPWDGNNWNIPNTSMVAAEDTGTLGSRAWLRLAGKPFTMSEYDHPAPNDHSAELFPMLASFAAFQDWDGLYQFNYSSRSDAYDVAKVQGYFELCSHPGKTAFLPIAALMFRMGAVQPGTDPLLATVPTGDLARVLATRGQGFAPASDLKTAAVLRPVGFRLAEGNGDIAVPDTDLPDGRRASNTGEIVWDVTDKQRATYTVNAPGVRAAVGWIGGQEIKLGDAAVHVTKAAKDWACVALGALDGKPLAESSKILVVAAGRVENTGMGWNEDRTTVGRNWGNAPTVAEGITATIRLPGAAKVSVLDGTGRPTTAVRATSSPAGTEFEIGPQYKTLWYAVTR